MLGNGWPVRIHIVGTCGAGKTSLARSLADALDYTHVELDALHWDANWTAASPDEFRRRVAGALGGDRWVVDGNYALARDLIWAMRPTVIWLDYEFGLVMRRLFRRTLGRMISREELWNGNRERIRTQLTSRDSILWWGLTTYHDRRRRYPGLFAAHGLDVLRLGHPKEADELVATARDRSESLDVVASGE